MDILTYGALLNKVKEAKPTDEQVAQAVEEWLDDHPEATTTVQDGSITHAKLDSDLQDAVDEIPDLKSQVTKQAEEIGNGNFVKYTSKQDIENAPVVMTFTNTTDSSDLNTSTGAITSGNKTISDYIDIRDFVRMYLARNGSTKFLSNVYCLYDAEKVFIPGTGHAGTTDYDFETIDGHANCISFDLTAQGACYIRTSLYSANYGDYYAVTQKPIYDFEYKETRDARTDYNGVSQSTLKIALDESYSAIKNRFAGIDAQVEGLMDFESIGTADLVFPHHSAKTVKMSTDASTLLGIHGITVADFDHMGVVTYSNIEAVSDYTGPGKKYKITTLGENGLAYRVNGKASGLTVGKTYRICLKITDPQNDSSGGGHYAQVACNSRTVKSIGNTLSTERVYSDTFVATATTRDLYVYPFMSNGGAYVQAVGDEFVIDDMYINEVNGNIDFFSHEAVIAESVTATELQYELNGKMFVATGVGADVSIAYMRSKLLTVNGLMPDIDGNVAVKSHLQGKTVVCFGDSITNKGYYEYKDYPYLSSLITGMNTINVGIGGTSMRYRTNYDNWNKVSFAHMADMIASGDFSDIQTLGNTSGFEMKDRCAQLYPVISAIDWNSVDIITLAFGANDHETSTVVNYRDDESDKMNKYKYLGAFRYALETILAQYPQIQFLVITPVFRFWTIQGEYTDSDKREFSDINNTTSYYYEWGDDLMKCAKDEYHVPVVDFYRELGISEVNHAWFSTDGVHPDYDGLARMASHLASALMSKF